MTSLRFVIPLQLLEHDLFPKTGIHPGPSPGQTFSGSCSESTLELQAREPRIEAAGGDQLLMRALLDDAARVHDKDAVAREHGGEPVGDDQRGAVRHQL